MKKTDLQLFDTLTAAWLDESGDMSMRADQVKLLINRGANPNAFAPKTTKPLWQIALNDPLLLEPLIDGGADLSMSFDFQDVESAAALQLLIENGVNPSLSKDGQSLLHHLWCIFYDKEDPAPFVAALSAGANIEDLFLNGIHMPYQPSILIEKIIAEKRSKKTLDQTKEISR